MKIYRPQKQSVNFDELDNILCYQDFWNMETIDEVGLAIKLLVRLP